MPIFPKPKPTSADADSAPVPRLYDDPRIVPAQALLTTFNERYEYVKRRRLQLDGPSAARRLASGSGRCSKLW